MIRNLQVRLAAKKKPTLRGKGHEGPQTAHRPSIDRQFTHTGFDCWYIALWPTEITCKAVRGDTVWV